MVIRRNNYKTKFANITRQTSVIIICSSDAHATATASSLAMTSFGIPLTGSMSAGFTIGFMEG
jgi:ribonuclease PH